MKVNRASDGCANLHVWREGREYWCQKSPVFLKEWTNVQFSLVPRPADGKVNYHDLRQPLRFADNTFDDGGGAAFCGRTLPGTKARRGVPGFHAGPGEDLP